MPHRQAKVFWQFPSAGTDKMTNAQQMPGGGEMGKLGIDWAKSVFLAVDGQDGS